MKLWGGRFKGEADAEFARFNASFSFDRRLIEADIEASLAHAEALFDAGVIDGDEARKIELGLKEILRRSREEAGYLDSRDAEDVHSFIEAELVHAIGDAGYKLHTGRSRNDQVATALRLFLRGQTDEVCDLIVGLQRAISRAGRSEPRRGDARLHSPSASAARAVRALPAGLLRDDEARPRAIGRMRARARTVCRSGRALLPGRAFAIDREKVARRLGFEGITENSLDGVSDRDFVIEFVGAAAIVMVHLSRLSEDLIIYSTAEFGFVELSDAVSTGSSLMPQKKNPDSLELIRGKAGRVFGHHAALLAMMKGLPLAYNKDMQEDKEALFDTIDTLRGSLSVMTTVIGNIRVNGERASRAASEGYSNATDLADYLARRGLEFRRAHDLVGRVVSYAIEQGKSLEEVSLEEYRRFSPLFDEELYDALTLDASLAKQIRARRHLARASRRSARACARQN